MPLQEASEILDADFRPPCRRGDLDAIGEGVLVGLVDGLFHQSDAVSPREITYALKRGATILGSSSMGALRAMEVPGIEGVGHIYQMYRHGIIDGDDEVALLFNPDTFSPLTVPLVNVRYAVDRLQKSQTITSSVGQRILDTARKLHFSERTYKLILQEAGLSDKADTPDLLHLLNYFDLKRDDARLLLERLSNIAKGGSIGRITGRRARAKHQPDCGPAGDFASVTRQKRLGASAPVHIWETGDTVSFDDLVLFLKLTGKFEMHASNAITLLLQSGALRAERNPPVRVKDSFRGLCTTWGWRTSEELRVTMADLGLPLKDVLGQLKSRTRLQQLFLVCARSSPEAFLRALRSQLFSNDIALKRETMRCGSLPVIATRYGSEDDKSYDGKLYEDAKAALCRLHKISDWKQLVSRFNDLGVSNETVQKFVITLGNARKHAKEITKPGEVAPNAEAADIAFGLCPSRKPVGTDRFSLPISEAYKLAIDLKKRIGVTRIGMITGLTKLAGVHVSQVARPDGAWSSSYGSGKSDTKEGAVIGGVMEETEKWAQERFKGTPVRASYADMREREENVLNPRLLDLPYDSRFKERTKFEWCRCTDLIAGSFIWVPLAAVACPFNARDQNPFYSARGARVVFSTNGLASGFTLAEAMVHATSEYVERHAMKICELQVENPGLDFSCWRPRRVNLDSLADASRSLVESLKITGHTVCLWDVTSEIPVPTIMARLVPIEEGRPARGWATHPNPAVASHMALLEACQTLACQVAAGREDLTVQARSLGRHERASPMRRSAEAFWNSEDGPSACLANLGGLIANDVYDEFVWLRRKLVEAGIRHLVAANLTRDEIKPAHIVRVVLPGLETTNPFYCGPRARVTLLSDMLSSDLS